MIATFVKLSLELQPPVFLNIVAFNGPLAPLKLFELNQILVTSPTYGVNVSVIALRICEVGSTSVHKFPLLKDVALQDVLVNLVRIGTPD